jgi:hypothetical protein
MDCDEFPGFEERKEPAVDAFLCPWTDIDYRTAIEIPLEILPIKRYVTVFPVFLWMTVALGQPNEFGGKGLPAFVDG